MKKSYYNIPRKQTDGTTVIYNSRTGAVLVFNEAMLNAYQSGDLSEVESLKQLGIFVPEDYDELRLLESERREAIENPPKVLKVTIAPTTSCNARCPYCFERGREHNNMSVNTAMKAVEFLQQNSIDKHVAIQWFGGEPLLMPNIIDYISKEIIAAQKAKQLEYHASITTNGSLANADMVQCMLKWQIESAQITIDGIGEEYQRRKRYVSNENHFETVIQNIQVMLENDIAVKARIHFDKTNLSEVKKTVKFLVERFRDFPKFHCYVFPLLGYQDQEGLYQYDELEDVLRELYMFMHEVGYFNSIKSLGLNPRNIHCGAERPNVLCIDPLGRLYKCEHHLMIDEQTVGDVFQGISKNDTYNRWVNYRVMDKCKTCKLLPCCQGGCIANRGTNIGDCQILKANLNNLLDLAYKIHQERGYCYASTSC